MLYALLSFLYLSSVASGVFILTLNGDGPFDFVNLQVTYHRSAEDPDAFTLQAFPSLSNQSVGQPFQVTAAQLSGTVPLIFESAGQYHVQAYTTADNNTKTILDKTILFEVADTPVSGYTGSVSYGTPTGSTGPSPTQYSTPHTVSASVKAETSPSPTQFSPSETSLTSTKVGASKSHVPVIVGAIIGSIAACIIPLLLIRLLLKRRLIRRRQNPFHDDHAVQGPGATRPTSDSYPVDEEMRITPFTIGIPVVSSSLRRTSTLQNPFDPSPDAMGIRTPTSSVLQPSGTALPPDYALPRPQAYVADLQIPVQSSHVPVTSQVDIETNSPRSNTNIPVVSSIVRRTSTSKDPFNPSPEDNCVSTNLVQQESGTASQSVAAHPPRPESIAELQERIRFLETTITLRAGNDVVDVHAQRTSSEHYGSDAGSYSITRPPSYEPPPPPFSE